MGLNTILWTSAETALESAVCPHQAAISAKKTMGQNTILLITQKSWLLAFKTAPESAQKTFASNGVHRS
jgi:hypothetical protein